MIDPADPVMGVQVPPPALFETVPTAATRPGRNFKVKPMASFVVTKASAYVFFPDWTASATSPPRPTRRPSTRVRKPNSPVRFRLPQEVGGISQGFWHSLCELRRPPYENRLFSAIFRIWHGVCNDLGMTLGNGSWVGSRR